MGDTYPGSKQQRRDPAVPFHPPARAALGWDRYPVYLELRGETREFFRRGAFAAALNRQLVSIRAMVTAGVIPNPRVKDKHGRWLYTREQIEEMIELAIEEGVIDPRKRVRFSERFVSEAHRILGRVP